MDIIIVNDFGYVNGGAANVAISEALELSMRNYRVTFFCGVGPIDPRLTKSNVKTICLNQADILTNPSRLHAATTGIWNRNARRVFSDLLDTHDINNTIIHVHAFAKSLSSSIIYEAQKRGFKVVFHIHDYGLACPNMGFYNYQKHQICQLKPLSIKCLVTNCDSRKYSHKIWRSVRQYVQKYITKFPNNTPYFIALSPFSVKVLKPFIPDKAKIYFLENPHKVVEKKVDVTKNKKYVFVGRLSKEKNPVLLAKVAKKFGIEVLFVGDGEERQSIINNNPDAEITGWVDGDKVKEYLLTARALVMTSNWYEGQPLVVGEALGQGIPVVVPDTCAAIDVVQHGYNGLIFKSNNEASLYEALKLLESNSFLKELSNNAYKKFWSKPPIIDTHVNALINIYNEILKG